MSPFDPTDYDTRLSGPPPADCAVALQRVDGLGAYSATASDSGSMTRLNAIIFRDQNLFALKRPLSPTKPQ